MPANWWAFFRPDDVPSLASLMAKTVQLGICCVATIKRNRRKKEVSEENFSKQLWPCIISVMLQHNYLGCICKDD